MPIYILPDPAIVPELVLFDAIKSYEDNAQAVVTTHPVEAGSNPADHVRPEARIITLTGFVTNHPTVDLGGYGRMEELQIDVADFGIPVWEPPFDYTPGAVFREAGAVIGDALGAIGDALFGPSTPATVTVFGSQMPFNRRLEMETLLDKIRIGGVVCTVVTSEREFPSMVLTNITQRKIAPHASDFDLVFQELITVTTGIVKAPKPAEPRGAPGANAGQQGTKPVGTKDAVRSVSIIQKLRGK